MPLTGHLWPKLGCCTKSFPISGQILEKAGFLVKCGLIWLNKGINVAWVDWTFTIYTTPLTFRDWKQCHEKYFYFVKRAIPIGNFVGYHSSIILYFLGLWGHLPPRMDSFVYTRSDLVMPLNGHLGPKLDCCKNPLCYQDQILDINCWVHVLMRLNFTQHGHQCSLIWLNIGNLHKTPHIS